MIPINNMDELESNLCGKNECAVLLLLVQPTDEDASAFIDKFNYYHFEAGEDVTVFAGGYSQGDFQSIYRDARKACSVDGNHWWFSEQCFVKFKNQLEKRIKWRYSGEPEILILQRGAGKHSHLDFSNYVAIDVCQGLREGYIDSVPRLMEALIQASKDEVRAKRVLKQATKLSSKRIVDTALQLVLEVSRCPASIKEVISNRAFYRTANSRGRA